MKFRELDIPKRLKEALDEQGFDEMYPHQAEAIPKALTGNNLVVTVPTAGGKSMIGFIPAMKTVLEKHKKVLYIVPLKALASEKRDDLDKFSHLGFKVVQATGDPDRDDDVSDADIVIATSEKADSMARHNNTWIKHLGLIIADEVHMIHDPGRGPTLEVTITKFIRNIRKLQVIALSATISNSDDLAMWLNADLVKSDFRPTELREGVYYDEKITFTKGMVQEVPNKGEDLWSMVEQTVEGGGQCLIFVNSRRSTESVASKYSKKMKKLTGAFITPADALILEGGAESTSVGKKLAECVDSGIAFHHAGLAYMQRKFVEDGFRNRSIKCIVATPTLAAGINLPARRVIVRDTTRFESNAGNVPIPVMEIKQMLGRAGRPHLDPWGEAVLMANSRDDFDRLMDDYLFGDSERLTSKLGNEIILRGHILGLVSTDDVQTEKDIEDFMEKTFYGATCDLYGVDMVITNVLDFLMDHDMVEMCGSFNLHEDMGEYLQIYPEHRLIESLYREMVSLHLIRELGDTLELIDRDNIDGYAPRYCTPQVIIDMLTGFGFVSIKSTTYEIPDDLFVRDYDVSDCRNVLSILQTIGCILMSKNLFTVAARSHTVRTQDFFEMIKKRMPDFEETILGKDVIELILQTESGGAFDADEIISLLLDHELAVKKYDSYAVARPGYSKSSCNNVDLKLCNRILENLDELGCIILESGSFSAVHRKEPLELRSFYSTIVHRLIHALEDTGTIERFYPDPDRPRDFRILNFGKRSSDLYIDPWTAVILKKAVMKIDEHTDEMMIMQTIACTPDVMGLYPKKDDMDELESLDAEYDGKWLCNLKDECGIDDADAAWDNHLADLKTAVLLDRWIGEISEEAITDFMKIGPGDIRSRVDNANWIVYAMNEVALQFNPDASTLIKPLLTRIRYGIKEELIPLVSFKGIARSRARTLFNAGLRTRQDIVDVDVATLAALPKIGKSLAASLKEQVGHKSRDSFAETLQQQDEDDDDIAFMLEKMAAEDEAMNNPKPVEEKPKGRKTAKTAGSKNKQSSLDFF